MVPSLLEVPVPEPVESSVVELEPEPPELLPCEPLVLDSVSPVEPGPEVIGGVVVNGDVSAWDG